MYCLPAVLEYGRFLLKEERDYGNVLLICIIGGINVICCSEDCGVLLLNMKSLDSTKEEHTWFKLTLLVVANFLLLSTTLSIT